jgi:hypothetical protein
MLKTLQLLNDSPVIQTYAILDFKQGSDFYYLKCSAKIKDGTELHIKEYASVSEFVYSYNWQRTSGEMIVRWDNAPNHPSVKTHPHHKHAPDVEESNAMDLAGVLHEIEVKLGSSN